ncbi:hypothetical protein J6590_004776 [Homalodisca vitripennis]|nr:hypothetical protein J6590_004776 [Homalodisca vitripennis]
MVLQSSFPRVVSDLLSLSRSVSSQALGLITGHGHLKKHLHRVCILREDLLRRMGDEQQETAEHLLFDCPAIAWERYATFGSLGKPSTPPLYYVFAVGRAFNSPLPSPPAPTLFALSGPPVSGPITAYLIHPCHPSNFHVLKNFQEGFHIILEDDKDL